MDLQAQDQHQVVRLNSLVQQIIWPCSTCIWPGGFVLEADLLLEHSGSLAQWNPWNPQILWTPWTLWTLWTPWTNVSP